MSNGRKIKRGMKPKAQSIEAPEGFNVEGALSTQGQQEMTPEQRKKIQTMQAMLTDMVYHDSGKQHIQQMLDRGDPGITIPQTVNTLFLKFEDMTREKLGDMPLDMKLAGGVHLFSEIMELAEAKGVIPEDMPQEQIQPLLKNTIQQYIQRGLKDKTIDPIELQKGVEPLLNKQEKEIGAHMANATGTPPDLTDGQITNSLMDKAQAPLRLENAGLKKQNQGMQQALQGIAQGPPEGQQG